MSVQQERGKHFLFAVLSNVSSFFAYLSETASSLIKVSRSLGYIHYSKSQVIPIFTKNQVVSLFLELMYFVDFNFILQTDKVSEEITSLIQALNSTSKSVKQWYWILGFFICFSLSKFNVHFTGFHFLYVNYFDNFNIQESPKGSTVKSILQALTYEVFKTLRLWQTDLKKLIWLLHKMELTYTFKEI